MKTNRPRAGIALLWLGIVLTAVAMALAAAQVMFSADQNAQYQTGPIAERAAVWGQRAMAAFGVLLALLVGQFVALWRACLAPERSAPVGQDV